MPTVRDQVLLAIAQAKEGLTADEVEQLLRLTHQSTSARVHDLALAGLIVAKGRRATRSGRGASVWFAAKTKGKPTAKSRKAFERLLGITVELLERTPVGIRGGYAKRVEEIVRSVE